MGLALAVIGGAGQAPLAFLLGLLALSVSLGLVLMRDGFDQYGTSQALIPTYWNGTNATGLAMVTGRFGGKAVQFTNPTQQIFAFASSATIVVGCAFRLDSANGNDSFPPVIIGMMDGINMQLQLGIDQNRHLVIKRGQNGTTIATSTNVLTSAVWYHCEFKATINNSAGVVEVRINGSSSGWIPSTSSLNTRSTSNNSTNGVSLTGNIAGIQLSIDDLYVLDTTAGGPNDFQGDCRIQTVYPNGNGATHQFSITGGDSNNYQAVSHVPPDDTKYVNDAVVDDRDIYDFTDLSTTYTILDACVLYRAEKSDAGTRSIKPVAKSGATTNVATAITLGSSFLYYAQGYATDPNTGVAWTAANLNSAQFGQDVGA